MEGRGRIPVQVQRLPMPRGTAGDGASLTANSLPQVIMQRALGNGNPNSANAEVSARRPCGHCGEANAATDRFCSHCGKGLWEKCPSCPREVWFGDRFCGGCGQNLESSARAKVAELEGTLTRARAIAEQFDFDEAIRLAKIVANVKDIRLQKICDEARLTIADLESQQREWVERREAALPQAEMAYKSGDRARVVELLAPLPKNLLPEPAQKMLDSCQLLLGESKELKQQIDASLERGDKIEIGQLVTRWLDLIPEDPWGTFVAEKVSEALLAAAEKRLSKGSIDGCLKRLDAIPPSHRGDAFNKLNRRVEEIRWLKSQLKSAVVVHPGLTKLSERLVRMLPSDESLAKLPAQLERLQSQKPERPEDLFPTVTARGLSWFGTHVAHLGRWSRISSPYPDPVRKRSTAFAGAIGLALEGLGESAFPMELTAESQGLFKRLVTRRSKSNVAWGLDLGAAAVKLVRMAKRGTEFVIEAAEHLPYDVPLTHPTMQTRLTEAIGKKLQKIREQHDLTTAPVICGMSAMNTLGRFIEIPSVTGRKGEELIRREAAMQLPVALDQLGWDYHSPEVKTDLEVTNFLGIVAIRKALLQQTTDLLRIYKVQPTSFQSIPMAIANAAAWEWSEALARPGDGSDEAPRPAVVMMDVGAEASTLIVVTQGRFWFRSFGFAGDEVTRTMTRAFLKSFEEVEPLKRKICDLTPLHPIYAQFDPMFHALVERMQRSMEEVRRVLGRIAPVGVWCCGGGALLHGWIENVFHSPSATDLISDQENEGSGSRF
jgi:Tfp pilus assembly PilM family ATPase